MKLLLALLALVLSCAAAHPPSPSVRPALLSLSGGGKKAKSLEEPPPPLAPAPKSSNGSNGLSLAATCIGAVAVWIGFATLYYAKRENWPYAQSLFYAVDTGMSIGFGTVAEQRLSTKLFTVAHVLMGASAVGGAIALFAESAVSGSTAISNAEYTMASVRSSFIAADTDASGSLSHSELEAVLRKCCPRLSAGDMVVAVRAFDTNGDGQVTIEEFLAAVSKYVDGETTVDDAVSRSVEEKTSSAFSKLLRAARASLADNRLIALWLVWIVGGAVWGVLTEGWHPINGLYFAVGALATGGLEGPALNAQGTIPDGQAAFVALYCLTGIPIFAMALGQFANVFVERHLAAKDRQALTKPITRGEFEFAQSLFSGDGKVDLSEFMALELLRLGKVDTNTLHSITREFRRLDKDGDGHLKASEIDLAD